MEGLRGRVRGGARSAEALDRLPAVGETEAVTHFQALRLAASTRTATQICAPLSSGRVKRASCRRAARCVMARVTCWPSGTC